MKIEITLPPYSAKNYIVLLSPHPTPHCSEDKKLKIAQNTGTILSAFFSPHPPTHPPGPTIEHVTSQWTTKEFIE
jgi:hypothetical protein